MNTIHHPEFMIRVPTKGYLTFRGREWLLTNGESIARWKKRKTAEKWLAIVQASFPTAIIHDNSVTETL